MLSVATKAINDIRERAGARLLTSSLAGTIDSRDIVRKERRKELAFEHKTKWDLRRWRVNHYEGRDGFWGEQRDRTVSATRPLSFPWYLSVLFDGDRQVVLRRLFQLYDCR